MNSEVFKEMYFGYRYGYTLEERRIFIDDIGSDFCSALTFLAIDLGRSDKRKNYFPRELRSIQEGITQIKNSQQIIWSTHDLQQLEYFFSTENIPLKPRKEYTRALLQELFYESGLVGKNLKLAQYLELSGTFRGNTYFEILSQCLEEIRRKNNERDKTLFSDSSKEYLQNCFNEFDIPVSVLPTYSYNEVIAGTESVSGKERKADFLEILLSSCYHTRETRTLVKNMQKQLIS